MLPVLLAGTFSLHFLPVATADIVRWDTAATIPHTQGLTLTPGVDLSNNGRGLNLSYANMQADLSYANFSRDNLSHARFSQTHTSTGRGGRGGGGTPAVLTQANFTKATITYAWFNGVTDLTEAQLASTASYQRHNLTGVHFENLNLAQWNFSRQNLTQVSFDYADLTGTNLTGAIIKGAFFYAATGLTSGQLYTTASYQKHDLSNTRFSDISLAGWDFSHQNLTGAYLAGTDLTNASFNGANLSHAMFYPTPGGWTPDLSHADFSGATINYANFRETTGLTQAQLVSTKSYQRRDLTGISLARLNMSQWNLSGQNLTDTWFEMSDLTGADLTGATIQDAFFYFCTGFNVHQLYSTASYQHYNLSEVSLEGMDLTGSDLEKQNLTRSDLGYTTLRGANLISANLGHAYLNDTVLTNADMTNANIGYANFDNAAGFTEAQLASTRSYKLHNLQGLGLEGMDLSSWNFTGQNLTGTTFAQSALQSTDFTAATIKNCEFYNTTGMTEHQLDSTNSYLRHDLSGIMIVGVDMTGWNFKKQNLTKASFGSGALDGADFTSANLSHAIFAQADLQHADFTGANLTYADFSQADLRGSDGWSPRDKCITANTIRPDGFIHGLALTDYPYTQLTIHNDDIPITVDTYATFDINTRLDFQLQKDWGSTMSFLVIPQLGGTLRIDLDADPNTLVGQTFHLFEWNVLLPTDNRFATIYTDTRLTWDLTNLYLNGTVTATGLTSAHAAMVESQISTGSVPEPVTCALMLPALLLTLRGRPRRIRPERRG
jgi:uncharacterized protein YjbI with pentapeptide repeats